jgi:hypothetical protein
VWWVGVCVLRCVCVRARVCVRVWDNMAGPLQIKFLPNGQVCMCVCVCV